MSTVSEQSRRAAFRGCFFERPKKQVWGTLSSSQPSKPASPLATNAKRPERATVRGDEDERAIKTNERSN